MLLWLISNQSGSTSFLLKMREKGSEELIQHLTQREQQTHTTNSQRQTSSKMKIRWSPLQLLLLSCSLLASQANRVYVHPFHLFAAENVSCETLNTQTSRPLQTLPVAPLDINALGPDSREQSSAHTQRQNITERTDVLAVLQNTLGLRMYQALSRMQPSTNTLLSPISTYGTLVNLYLGASKRTASSFQKLLGLSSDSDREDCVSLVDGSKVLRALHSINSLVDDGPKDEITTKTWTITGLETQLSEDFIQGTQDFSDASFTRGIDFSKPQEAEQLLDQFVEKTSNGRVTNPFKDLNTSSDLLFLTLFNFQGSWRTAFKPEKNSLQEFHFDEATKEMVPMMTHTGQYHYLNDKVLRCAVVKLPLSQRSYMLLVLPHEGANLIDLELKLRVDVMSDWYTSIQERLLELSLPQFSLSLTNDMRDLLTNMNPEIEAKLLGSEAEFSQLSSVSPFRVDQVVSKVVFEMSEGAEVLERTPEAGVPLELSFNRPFFFAVIEGQSNAILLLGKITNPTL